MLLLYQAFCFVCLSLRFSQTWQELQAKIALNDGFSQILLILAAQKLRITAAFLFHKL